MDGRQFDQVSKRLSAWVSRRKLFTGLTAGAVGSILLRGSGSGKSQGGGYEETPVDPPAELEQSGSTEDFTTEDYTTEEYTTDDIPTDTPTPTPTDTPTPTPTDTPTPTEESTPGEGQGAGQGQGPPPEQTGGGAPRDDSRRRIAELCAQAADVLDSDLDNPGDFARHPHPAQAIGFLDRLQVLGTWGLEAESWDDAMVANYVNAFDAVALGVRIGADAFYEVQALEAESAQTGGDQALGFQPIKREGSGDPETCIFDEINKWTTCIEVCQKDEDTPLCRVECFWNFTVLQSCRRCLRAF